MRLKTEAGERRNQYGFCSQRKSRHLQLSPLRGGTKLLSQYALDRCRRLRNESFQKNRLYFLCLLKAQQMAVQPNAFGQRPVGGCSIWKVLIIGVALEQRLNP